MLLPPDKSIAIPTLFKGSIPQSSWTLRVHGLYAFWKDHDSGTQKVWTSFGQSSEEVREYIGVLFRVVWSKIEDTGLDAFYSIYRGHLFFQKDTFERICVSFFLFYK